MEQPEKEYVNIKHDWFTPPKIEKSFCSRCNLRLEPGHENDLTCKMPKEKAAPA